MITTNNLTKKFGDFVAVDNLSISVKEGEILCLLGANGAGKSTTINMLLNFIKPTSGTAEINGMDVVKNPLKTKEFVTYIPENLMLYPSLTAIENLDYFSGIAGKKLSSKTLTDFLREAGLQETAFKKRISTFSKGMRQKVGIALALAKDTKVLLLDEPTSGLDPKASNEFGELLQNLKNKGVAVLMATHDLFRAKEVATHIGIMKDGQLRQQFVASDISLPELEKAYLDTMNYKEVLP
ncbi:ATP-binding cassette domain-containing protein [Muricauda ruestringensis]|jgi:ABC-2 type transport system ATP-binding protein|uniref:ABC transporter ATP-binding protein n=1 Tax=Flagellimonas marinaquae TaxID=254955 RepID=A0AA48H8K4_9FLAO|nr:ATP-binding cassette domain-containing protein [Allomuricauda ruestringensis]MCA0958704.1 ATP-binding cassette domain-containing protein [Allomuricauda ruestringensis]BDW92349.1 ABC transporter ATP-binding protein [Allomuricauda aquimarina]